MTRNASTQDTDATLMNRGETDLLLEEHPSPHRDTRNLRHSFILAASFAAILWLIKLVELSFSLNLVQFGVYPRTLDGLTGILWAPLIHGSLSHLFANTAPIIVLGSALLYAYSKSAKIVIPTIYLGSGLGVWLFARSAYHIGASGLTFGMLFFLLTIGILRWDRRAIAFSLAVSFLYGGMIWGVFPTTSDISFESHLFGAIIGMVLAFKLKNQDPPLPEKTYSWEGEEEGSESVNESTDKWQNVIPRDDTGKIYFRMPFEVATSE